MCATDNHNYMCSHIMCKRAFNPNLLDFKVDSNLNQVFNKSSNFHKIPQISHIHNNHVFKVPLKRGRLKSF